MKAFACSMETDKFINLLYFCQRRLSNQKYNLSFDTNFKWL